jgi:transcriptional regulator with XRE-family HTH domain
MTDLHLWLDPMQFPSRLIQFRKEQGFSQQSLADSAQIHVNQIRRYEAGTAQPTLDALIRLAKALHLSLDSLVFDDRERGPSDDLALHFEAISDFTDDERKVAKAVLEGLIIKHQAGRFSKTLS